jgi:hypothetical protein
VQLWLQQEGYEATSSGRPSAGGPSRAGRPAGNSWSVPRQLEQQQHKGQLLRRLKLLVQGIAPLQPALLTPIINSRSSHSSKTQSAFQKSPGVAGVAGGDCDPQELSRSVLLEAQLPLQLPDGVYGAMWQLPGSCWQSVTATATGAGKSSKGGSSRGMGAAAAGTPGPALPPPPRPNGSNDGSKTAKRARILRDGELTLIPYGHDESQLWLKRVATFIASVR